MGIAELRGVRGLPAIRSGGFRGAPCGAVRVRVGGAVMRLRVTGSAAAFAQGRPLLARACGAPVTLATGAQHLQVLGGTFAVDDLRLQSPPPAPLADRRRRARPGRLGRHERPRLPMRRARRRARAGVARAGRGL